MTVGIGHLFAMSCSTLGRPACGLKFSVVLTAQRSQDVDTHPTSVEPQVVQLEWVFIDQSSEFLGFVTQAIVLLNDIVLQWQSIVEVFMVQNTRGSDIYNRKAQGSSYPSLFHPDCDPRSHRYLGILSVCKSLRLALPQSSLLILAWRSVVTVRMAELMVSKPDPFLIN